MKKQVSIAYIIVFLLLFIFPMGIYELWDDHFDQTNFEKREAAEKPVFSINAIEEYPKAYEAYFNDSLPFRNQMITTNNLLNLHLFKYSAVKKVIIGKDGWLFYNPAEPYNDPMADYYGKNLFAQEELVSIASNLTETRDILKSQGKEFVVMIAPNKVSIYGDTFLPNNFEKGTTYTCADQLCEYLAGHTDLSVVFPKERLFSAMQKNPNHIYYHKTDTHWNNLGSYIGTKALLEQVGIHIPSIEEYEVVTTKKYAGDLARMLGLKDYMEYDTVYNLSDNHHDRKVELMYPAEDHDSLILSVTTNADERSLLMIRDSFAAAMIPYLSKQFNTCTFSHINQFTPDILQKYPSDIVVLEVVERNTSNLANFRIQ